MDIKTGKIGPMHEMAPNGPRKNVVLLTPKEKDAMDQIDDASRPVELAYMRYLETRTGIKYTSVQKAELKQAFRAGYRIGIETNLATE